MPDRESPGTRACFKAGFIIRDCERRVELRSSGTDAISAHSPNDNPPMDGSDCGYCNDVLGRQGSRALAAMHMHGARLHAEECKLSPRESRPQRLRLWHGIAYAAIKR